MTPAAIIAAIAAVMNEAVTLGPQVIKAVEDATPFAEAIYGIFKGTNITRAQLDALVAEAQALSAQLQVPLPPDDGTTTT